MGYDIGGWGGLMVERVYPRARLDALSDAVFGVAMTLLVLDVRLPEEFHPHIPGASLRNADVDEAPDSESPEAPTSGLL